MTFQIAAAILLVVLSERLGRLRKLAGLSNSELDRLSELRKGHSWAIEHNDKANPELRTIQGLAATLGTTVGYLANGEGDGPTATDVVEAVSAARERLAPPPKATTDVSEIAEKAPTGTVGP